MNETTEVDAGNIIVGQLPYACIMLDPDNVNVNYFSPHQHWRRLRYLNKTDNRWNSSREINYLFGFMIIKIILFMFYVRRTRLWSQNIGL